MLDHVQALFYSLFILLFIFILRSLCFSSLFTIHNCLSFLFGYIFILTGYNIKKIRSFFCFYAMNRNFFCVYK